MSTNYLSGLSRKVERSKHDILNRLLSKIGAVNPIPLLRSKAPWDDALLAERQVIIGGSIEGHKLWKSVSDRLTSSGASVVGHGPIKEYVEAESFTSLGKDLKNRRLVYDASHFKSSTALDDLYEFFHPLLQGLQENAKAIVIAPNPDCAKTPEQRAALWAVSGFVKSLSKEIARKSSTINLLCFNDNQMPSDTLRQSIAACSEYLLSDHSSFITGQIIHVNDHHMGDLNCSYAGCLAGNIVLITGAAGGIGLAMAKAFASEGSHVICVDQVAKSAALEQLCNEIDGHAMAMDLGSHDNHMALIDAIATEHKQLDIVIHNAGITRDRTLKHMTKQEWQTCLNINLRAVEELTRYMLERQMINQSNGRIIVMSSISGIGGNAGQCNYSAAKAGLIGFVEGLAIELKHTQITANAIAPGLIETEMTANLPFLTRQIAMRMASLAQIGLPQDVADAACFLASPFAAGINASVLRVCGGHVLGR